MAFGHWGSAIGVSLGGGLMTALLVIGGCRSGKSREAMRLAAASGARRVFVATCVPRDAEMIARVERHQAERDDSWQTIEEPLDLAGVLGREDAADRVVLIDCLTLWTSNLMAAGMNDGAIAERVGELARQLSALRGRAILVTNEVGGGIVPENPVARRFRDLAGLVNQRIAAACDQVVWMVAGIAVAIKEVKRNE